MKSAEDIALMKVASVVCNISELTKEILCAEGSETSNSKFNMNERIQEKEWNKVVVRKATEILQKLGIADVIHEKATSVIRLIGKRMLLWAEYHEVVLGFPREYCTNFFKNHFITQRGIIDSNKAAEELMLNDSLSITQRYKLACLYCFTDHIPALYRKIPEEERRLFYDADDPQKVRQIGLVKFWSYFSMGEGDRISEGENLSEFRLLKSVEAGSIPAIEYCLQRTSLRGKKNSLIDAALAAIKFALMKTPCWAVYQNFWLDDTEETNDLTIPKEYFIDIVHWLFWKMREDQQVDFLRKDIEYNHMHFPNPRSKALEFFLDWPYQDSFMKVAELMWDFLPETAYARLAMKIVKKIACEGDDLKAAEEKVFDYRRLLSEFWDRSPERYKRYMFGEDDNVNDDTPIPVEELLVRLYELKNLTYADRMNIDLILSAATNPERLSILSSEKGRKICKSLMEREKWDLVDEFVMNCVLVTDTAYTFKKVLCYQKETEGIYYNFVKNLNWHAAESFLHWSTFQADELIVFAKDLILSDEGKAVSIYIMSFYKDVRCLERFINSGFLSEAEMKSYKQDLILSLSGMELCVNLVTNEEYGVADEFIRYCLSSEMDIEQLKRDVPLFRSNDIICEQLSDFSEADVYDEKGILIERRTLFYGGKWETVERFLTWCFSSEAEIMAFKQNVLMNDVGVNIHYNLINCNQWGEAETLFSWLGLCEEEIRHFKKQTIFSEDVVREILSKAMHYLGGNKRFVDYGSDNEEIYAILRWCLNNKEDIILFKEAVMMWSECIYGGEDGEVLFRMFDLMTDKLFSDLDKKEQQVGMKRKAESSPSPKRIRNLDRESKEEE